MKDDTDIIGPMPEANITTGDKGLHQFGDLRSDVLKRICSVETRRKNVPEAADRSSRISVVTQNFTLLTVNSHCELSRDQSQFNKTDSKRIEMVCLKCCKNYLVSA